MTRQEILILKDRNDLIDKYSHKNKNANTWIDGIV